MASTLAARVGAGTIIAVGIVIVSLIWWKKKKRGDQDSVCNDRLSRESGSREEPGTDRGTSLVTMTFSPDNQETMKKFLKEKLKQAIDSHQNVSNLEEVVVTTKLKIGKKSSKKITPVTVQRKNVYKGEMFRTRSKLDLDHRLDDIANDLHITVLGQVPKDPKPPTSNVIVQTSAGKDTIVSASGDASLSQKASAVQVEGQITGSGDSSMPDNYVCENGVCRLVTEPQKTKSKQKVKFDPLAEAVTKSLTEFFEGRDDLENSTDDNKKKNSDKTESDRTETHQKDTGALDSVEPENARRTVVEQAIQPSKETKVSSSLSQQGQSSESIGQVQRSQESDEVLVEHQQTSDQGQRSPERDGGSAMTNGDTNEEDEDTWEVGRYDQDDISTAILVSQNTPGILSGGNAEILVALLSHPETKLQQAALNGIKKSSTFTRNQNLFREHGCLEKLSKLLRSKSMSLRLGVKSSQEVVSSVATAITNLSANTENHKNLESCVPTLVDLTLENETGESVCLSSLQALTNLSLTDQYHRHYTRLIQKLYDLLDTHQRSIQLQSLKVLVNLSCSTEMVPHILAAKSPSCLLELLKQGTDEALILRMTTLLANILHTVREENISVSSLPPDDKAPSPETMYSALYSVSSVGAIKSKVFLLCRHRNEDIKHQATRIYQLIAK